VVELRQLRGTAVVTTTTRRAQKRCRGEQGETLVEVLFALGILAVAITVIVASMAVAIATATRHRQQASANAYLNQAAETVEAAPYLGCETDPHYQAGLTAPTGWSVSVASHAQAMAPASGAAVDCPRPDTGLQKVNVSVTSPNGYTLSTEVVKRDDRT
jgi:type II secretory pathway pseudopilin PulG